MFDRDSRFNNIFDDIQYSGNNESIILCLDWSEIIQKLKMPDRLKMAASTNSTRGIQSHNHYETYNVYD